ncbi:MAG: NAD-dependent epimerase/dehydratase family protein, partial [Paracoccaceae bacterium]
MRVVVTGAGGFLGWHAAVHLHALNAAALGAGRPQPFRAVRLDRRGFCDPDKLARAVAGADAILHFAGVNRGPADRVEDGNPQIAASLARAIAAAPAPPHVVYANSVRAGEETPYGRSKRRAAEILGGATGRFTDLLLPHVFGEGARPAYNNVTATLIDALHSGRRPRIDRSGEVCLLHASAAERAAIGAAQAGMTGRMAPGGLSLPVPELWERLRDMHATYADGAFPDLGQTFARQLFNSYRAAHPRGVAVRRLEVRRDERGMLAEASKGGGGGQAFFSRTEPGARRGDHFHISKVERFVV